MSKHTNTSVTPAIERIASLTRFMNSVSVTIVESLNEISTLLADIADVREERALATLVPDAMACGDGLDGTQIAVDKLDDARDAAFAALRWIEDSYDRTVDTLTDARIGLRLVEHVDRQARIKAHNDKVDAIVSAHMDALEARHQALDDTAAYKRKFAGAKAVFRGWSDGPLENLDAGAGERD